MNRFIALAVLVVGSPFVHAEDWSQFRGQNGTGISSEAGLPVKWSKTEGLRWSMPLPGRGVSSPVVHGGKVYITCSSGALDNRLHVLAYDVKTGEKLWHRQLAATGGTNCHPMTCMAAPTPVADDSGVYAMFATGDLAAYDTDGTLRWYRSLVGDYPSITNQVGMAASPVLADGKLIVPMDNAGESFIAALDRKTGKNLWKINREREIGWVTPVVRTHEGKTEVIMSGRGVVTAYYGETGEKLWSQKGTGPSDIASATFQEGVLYSPGRGGTTALKAENGTFKELWKSPKLNGGMSSPLVYKNIVYAATGAGVVNAADAVTGKPLWDERIKGKASASPLAGDGKVYVFNEKGLTTVLKAADKTEILAENDLGEETLGTPAISGGAIFIRTDKTLFCVGAK